VLWLRSSPSTKRFIKNLPTKTIGESYHASRFDTAWVINGSI